MPGQTGYQFYNLLSNWDGKPRRIVPQQSPISPCPTGTDRCWSSGRWSWMANPAGDRNSVSLYLIRRPDLDLRYRPVWPQHTGQTESPPETNQVPAIVPGPGFFFIPLPSAPVEACGAFFRPPAHQHCHHKGHSPQEDHHTDQIADQPDQEIRTTLDKVAYASCKASGQPFTQGWVHASAQSADLLEGDIDSRIVNQAVIVVFSAHSGPRFHTPHQRWHSQW